MRKLLLIIVILLVAASALATDYTVGPASSGKDYEGADAVITCANAVSGGDSCVVYPGTYNGGSITNSGTSVSSWIHLITTDPTTPTDYSIGKVNFTNESYIKFEGFSVTDVPACNGCSYIQFIDNYANHGKAILGNEEGPDVGGCGSDSFCGDNILASGWTAVSGNKNNDCFKGQGNYWIYRDNYLVDWHNTSDAHIDFWQGNCGSFNDGFDYILLEGNISIDHNQSGGAPSFTQWFFENCSTGYQCQNFVARYNVIDNMVDSDIMYPFAGVTNYIVYNNDFLRAGQKTATHLSISGAVNGAAAYPNNLYYDTLATTGARGVNTTSSLCWNSLVYDPDGSVSFASGYCLDDGPNVIANSDPLLTDIDNGDYTISSALSPAVDAGGSLTTVSSATGSGSTITVTTPHFFQDGWAGVEPDCIAVGTVSNTVCISRGGINYTTGEITLTESIGWTQGDAVWLYKKSDGDIVLAGDAPDIGAEEYGVTEASTPATIQRDTIQRGMFVGGN